MTHYDLGNGTDDVNGALCSIPELAPHVGRHTDAELRARGIARAAIHLLLSYAEACDSEGEQFLEDCNTLLDPLGACGVEEVSGPSGNRLSYVNFGETYNATLCYDHEADKVYVGSWGGFYEQDEIDHAEESGEVRCGYCGEWSEEGPCHLEDGTPRHKEPLMWSGNHASLTMSRSIMEACSAHGSVDAEVAASVDDIDAWPTRADMEAELRELGAWDDLSTAEESTLRERLLWAFACNLRDDERERQKGADA
jgi:hypothetical protein